MYHVEYSSTNTYPPATGWRNCGWFELKAGTGDCIRMETISGCLVEIHKWMDYIKRFGGEYKVSFRIIDNSTKKEIKLPIDLTIEGHKR